MSGMVTIARTLLKTTTLEAKSASHPYCCANAPAVSAAGVANKILGIISVTSRQCSKYKIGIISKGNTHNRVRDMTQTEQDCMAR